MSQSRPSSDTAPHGVSTGSHKSSTAVSVSPALTRRGLLLTLSAFLPAAQVLAPLVAQAARVVARREGKRHALLFGVDEYVNEQSFRPLKGAANDAEALGQTIAKLGWQATVVTTRGTTKPTRNVILREIEKLRQRISPQGGDSVLLFFAGHGCMIGSERYFLPSDAESTTLTVTAETSFALSKLDTAFGASPLDLLFLAFDMCQVTPGRDGSTAATDAMQKPIIARDNNFAGATTGAGGAAKGVSGSTTTPAPKAPRVIEYAFACTPGERSYEWNSAGGGAQTRGYFAYFLEQAFLGKTPDKAQLTLAGMEQYVTAEVQAQVRANEGVSQVPTFRTDGAPDRSSYVLVAPGATSAVVIADPPAPSLPATPPDKPAPAPATAPPAAGTTRYPLLSEHITSACSVPAGQFTMGSTLQQVNKWLSENRGDQREWLSPEQPARPVDVPAFRIGKTPVTVGMYEEYTKASGAAMPLPPVFNPEWANKDHPMVHVTYSEVEAYCKWASDTSGLSFRIPTEAQWEKAARGTDGRTFPWEGAWDNRYVVCHDNSGSQVNKEESRLGKIDWAEVRVAPGNMIVSGRGFGIQTIGTVVEGIDSSTINWSRVREGTNGSLVEERSPQLPSRIVGTLKGEYLPKMVKSTIYGTRAAGTIPANASPYGCLDMAGNVYQWCSERGVEGGNRPAATPVRVVRGGSWNDDRPFRFRAATRAITLAPTDRKDTVGFRLIIG